MNIQSGPIDPSIPFDICIPFDIFDYGDESFFCVKWQTRERRSTPLREEGGIVVGDFVGYKKYLGTVYSVDEEQASRQWDEFIKGGGDQS